MGYLSVFLVLIILTAAAILTYIWRRSGSSVGVLIGIYLLLFIIGYSGFASATGIYPQVPARHVTPGNIASIDTAEVCTKEYPARMRHVTPAQKNRVYKLHGVDKEKCIGGCKIDHLVPLAIGGSNHIDNLWPHEYGSDRTVYMKTRLEVRLRKEVCSGTLNIEEAQTCIAHDWPACFDRFYPGVYK